MGSALIGAKTVIGGLVGRARRSIWSASSSGARRSARSAFSTVDDATNAQLQAALGQALTQTGTGTYHIPWPATPQGTVLHGQGPIATIHFNTAWLRGDGFGARCSPG